MIQTQATSEGGGGNPLGTTYAPDAPVQVEHALRVVIARKFNKNVADVTSDTTLKQLVAVTEDEVMAELQEEFGSKPEVGAEMKFSERATTTLTKFE